MLESGEISVEIQRKGVSQINSNIVMMKKYASTQLPRVQQMLANIKAHSEKLEIY